MRLGQFAISSLSKNLCLVVKESDGAAFWGEKKFQTCDYFLNKEKFASSNLIQFYRVRLKSMRLEVLAQDCQNQYCYHKQSVTYGYSTMAILVSDRKRHRGLYNKIILIIIRRLS